MIGKSAFLAIVACMAVILPLGCGDEATRRLAAPVVVIEEGTHTILLEADASPSELHAAEDLQAHVLACTGWEIPIVQGSLRDDASAIVLGRGPNARALGVDPDQADLGEQGYLIKTVPPHVVIAGSPEAGTLYGVHRFLEDRLGVRWYAPGVTKTPAAEMIDVPAADSLVKPAFLWRHTSYNWPGHDADFNTRQTRNNGSDGADSPTGIQHAHDGRCHSYFRYVSPGEFFDVHPEYFSEIGGVRISEDTQLCLTNPEVLEIVTERMLARMAAQPHVRQHNFSQMDHYNNCQCGPCSAMNALYGTAGGTQFWFVNELAERTSAVYPDKLIGTLAYMYTEEPPVGLEMHPNAAVWLCHMYPSCDSHPVQSCPLNADYKRRALAWSTITDHLYIWHYITNFTHYYNPFPNLRAMASDIRLYRDIGVEGIYLQGMGNSGGGGEFSLLRPWYGMKLLWDPDRDPDEIRRDFLQGYYGEAWEPIEEYIGMLHDKVADEDIHMHLYTNLAMGYMPDEVLARANELFDEAESAVADDPELLERVRVARMPLVYAKIFPRNGYAIEGGRLKWQGENATIPEVLGFLDRMEAHDFRVIREVAGEPELLVAMYLMVKINPKVVTIANDHLAVDVVPMLAARALRIRELQTGEIVTAWNVKKNLFFPFCGGLEDRVGGGFRFYGWAEPTAVEGLSDMSITTSTQTFDGFQLTRTMTLDPDEPILTVESTVTNIAQSTREARLRSHIELDLGDLLSTRVRFTSLAGEAVDKDMTDIIAGMREGEHYYDLDAPDGAWTLAGTKGLEVTQRFDNEGVDFTWLYAYPDTFGELEAELWAPSAELGPCESTTLSQEIEVRPARE